MNRVARSQSAPLNPTPEERATFDAGQNGMTQGWSGTMEQCQWEDFGGLGCGPFY